MILSLFKKEFKNDYGEVIMKQFIIVMRWIRLNGYSVWFHNQTSDYLWDMLHETTSYDGDHKNSAIGKFLVKIPQPTSHKCSANYGHDCKSCIKIANAYFKDRANMEAGIGAVPVYAPDKTKNLGGKNPYLELPDEN